MIFSYKLTWLDPCSNVFLLSAERLPHRNKSIRTQLSVSSAAVFFLNRRNTEVNKHHQVSIDSEQPSFVASAKLSSLTKTCIKKILEVHTSVLVSFRQQMGCGMLQEESRSKEGNGGSEVTFQCVNSACKSARRVMHPQLQNSVAPVLQRVRDLAHCSMCHFYFVSVKYVHVTEAKKVFI